MFDMTSLKLGDHVFDAEGNLYVLVEFDECHQYENCNYEYQGKMIDDVNGCYGKGSITVWDRNGLASPVDGDYDELNVAFALTECPW